jgi:hypothetical protein
MAAQGPRIRRHPDNLDARAMGAAFDLSPSPEGLALNRRLAGTLSNQTGVAQMIEFLIKMLARILIGSAAFERVLALVEKWAALEISNAEKREGVLGDIQVIGLKLTESAARLALELAVTFMKSKV